MDKQYNVFLEDLYCINTINDSIGYLTERIGLYNNQSEDVKKNLDNELSKLNNYKLNLIRKISHIKLNDLIQILLNTQGLKLRAYKHIVSDEYPPMELLVMLDETPSKPHEIGMIRIRDVYHTTRYPKSVKVFKAYRALEDSEIEPLQLNNIDKVEIVKGLINYDNDELFDNFIESYICYLNNLLESRLQSVGH